MKQKKIRSIKAGIPTHARGDGRCSDTNRKMLAFYTHLKNI